MAESPRRVDLRLTIPGGSPYRELAGELAAKFAEYVGAAAADAKQLSAQMESWLGAVPNAPAVDVEMSAQDHELVVTANAGKTTRRATCRLPD